MDFKLRGNRIIVIAEQQHDRTAGGIIIPEQKREKRNVGVIAEIGATVDKDFQHRRVIFEPFVGEEITYEGVDAIVMYSFDIIAFLN